MSDTYKTIAKARKYMLDFRSQGFNVTQLVRMTGLAHALICDILDNDPVSVKIREASIIKLRTFIDYEERHKEKSEESQPVLNKEEKTDFATIEVPESMEDAVPAETGIERDPHGTENLLNDLTKLADRFQKQGYRLNISIDLITTF